LATEVRTESADLLRGKLLVKLQSEAELVDGLVE
jgi:hypothetical protein